MTKKERKQRKYTKIKNKKLLKQYPFLLPRNVWTGKISDTYDYSYTYLDYMPNGWKNSFGLLLCEDLKQELMKSGLLNQYRIYDIKEKYGTLRWYSNFDTKEISSILRKYEYLSSKTCIICGKIDVPIFDDGWVSPYCEKCYRKNQKTQKDIEKYIIDNGKLKETFFVTKYSKEEREKKVEFDITPILERINKKYR